MIQRYSVDKKGVAFEHKKGDFVTYTDHLAALTARDETIRVLREALVKIVEYKGAGKSMDYIVVDMQIIARAAVDKAGAMGEQTTPPSPPIA